MVISPVLLSTISGVAWFCSALAEHAAGMGLVGPRAVGEVARERSAEDEERRSATVHSGIDSVAAALATSGERGSPPNVVVDGSGMRDA